MASHTEVKNIKAGLVKQFGKSPKNTGAAPVQIAILTHRINTLNKHQLKFPKDNHTKRGLLKLVGQRKKLLTYLRNSNEDSYAEVLQALSLRK